MAECLFIKANARSIIEMTAGSSNSLRFFVSFSWYTASRDTRTLYGVKAAENRIPSSFNNLWLSFIARIRSSYSVIEYSGPISRIASALLSGRGMERASQIMADFKLTFGYSTASSSLILIFVSDRSNK